MTTTEQTTWPDVGDPALIRRSEGGVTWQAVTISKVTARQIVAVYPNSKGEPIERRFNRDTMQERGSSGRVELRDPADPDTARGYHYALVGRGVAALGRAADRATHRLGSPMTGDLTPDDVDGLVLELARELDKVRGRANLYRAAYARVTKGTGADAC